MVRILETKLSLNGTCAETLGKLEVNLVTAVTLPAAVPWFASSEVCAGEYSVAARKPLNCILWPVTCRTAGARTGFLKMLTVLQFMLL